MDFILHLPLGISSNLMWFGISMILFVLLARYFSCVKGQSWWRKDSLTDTIYWFLMPPFYSFMAAAFIILLLKLIYGYDDAQITSFIDTRGALAQWPIWLQAIAILIVSDVLQYWLHRLFHRNALWKFHAIHHSAQELDWMTSARFHPVNVLLYATITYAITVVMGFSAAAFVLLQPFNILYSGMVHANLNWTFGPLRTVFASPVFHRWHHTMAQEGRDKNFAPTFPILDVMFGTFYMPKGKLPESYGIDGHPVPHSFLGQLAYPFRRERSDKAKAAMSSSGSSGA